MPTDTSVVTGAIQQQHSAVLALVCEAWVLELVLRCIDKLLRSWQTVLPQCALK